MYLDKAFKPSLNDALISGLTDVEGCFICSVYDNKSNTAKLVRLRYILSQKGNS